MAAPLVDRAHAQEKDAWASRWGDPALQKLGRWLAAHGIKEELADYTCQSVWVFYSYYVVPAAERAGGAGARPPLGIAAREIARGDASVQLYLQWPPEHGTEQSNAQAAQDEAWNYLKEAFGSEIERRFDVRPSPAPRLRLQAIRMPATTLALAPKHTTFEQELKHKCRADNLTYLGTFGDSLADELRLLVGSEHFDAWLASPSARWGGKSPNDLLGTPEDRPLRDLLLEATYGVG